MAGPVDGPRKPRRPRKLAAVPEPAVTVVFEPAYEAHRLRLSGLPWREVAGLTGYSSDVAAINAVTTYLQRAAIGQSAEQARLALATELDRLDALQVAWWPRALDGDASAANVVLKVIAQRARLLGLEDPDRRTATGPRTIIITGNAEEYVSQLREIAEGAQET